VILAAASHGPSTLWYATRGAGAVTLVLLTLSVVLGIGEFRMWTRGRSSRFATGALHRFVSLLALVFLAIHVVTVWIDPFPPIGLVNAIVPFQTSYRSLWLAFGTIACDLMLAVVVTSLVRVRLGYRPWRAVHLLAYAAWPVALLHGLGAGSDAKSTWMVALTAACVVAVLGAGATRISPPASTPRRRLGIAAAAAVGLVGLVVFMLQGPLTAGWARRAGTPPRVLAAFAPPAAARAPRVDPLARRFTAGVNGRIRRGVSQGGAGVIDLELGLSAPQSARLRLRLGGDLLPDGGLRMRRSAVTLGTAHDPGRYQGRIDFLDGTRIRALVGGGGHAIRLLMALALNPPQVTGRVQAIPVNRR
jgi:hypothetical protein